MRKLKIESHYNFSDLKEIMDSQSFVRAFQNWKIEKKIECSFVITSQ